MIRITMWLRSGYRCTRCRHRLTPANTTAMARMVYHQWLHHSAPGTVHELEGLQVFTGHWP